MSDDLPNSRSGRCGRRFLDGDRQLRPAEHGPAKLEGGIGPSGKIDGVLERSADLFDQPLCFSLWRNRPAELLDGLNRIENGKYRPGKPCKDTFCRFLQAAASFEPKPVLDGERCAAGKVDDGKVEEVQNSAFIE